MGGWGGGGLPPCKVLVSIPFRKFRKRRPGAPFHRPPFLRSGTAQDQPEDRSTRRTSIALNLAFLNFFYNYTTACCPSACPVALPSAPTARGGVRPPPFWIASCPSGPSLSLSMASGKPENSRSNTGSGKCAAKHETRRTGHIHRELARNAIMKAQRSGQPTDSI